MSDIYQQIDELTKSVKEIKDGLPKSTETVADNSSDIDYNKQQWVNFGWRIAIIAAIFFTQYFINLMNSPFWGISLGLFIGFMTETIVFIYDWVFIPGDTLKNAKNHSTYIIIVAASIWLGILIGDGYAPNVLAGEAKGGKVEKLQDTTPYEIDDRSSRDEGIPNR